MPHRPHLKHAYELFEQRRWAELLEEIEQLREYTWSEFSNPVSIRAVVTGMKAEALEKLGTIDEAATVLVNALVVERLHDLSLQFAELVLKHDLEEHFPLALKGLKRALAGRSQGAIPDPLSDDLTRMVAEFKRRMEQ